MPPILENRGPIFNKLPDISTPHNFPSTEFSAPAPGRGSGSEKTGPLFSTPSDFFGSREKNNILNGFSIGSDLQNRPTGPDKVSAGSDMSSKLSASGDLFKSIGEKLPQILAKVGEFLQKMLPPEYAQYVQEYLPMAEQYISSLLKDVNLSQGQNGAQHLDAELQESQSVPDLIPGSTLNVDQQLGFDLKSGASGAEISNIRGLHFSGDKNGDVKSARVDFADGEPRIYATVQSEDGQSDEVEIPVQDLLQQIVGQ